MKHITSRGMCHRQGSVVSNLHFSSQHTSFCDLRQEEGKWHFEDDSLHSFVFHKLSRFYEGIKWKYTQQHIYSEESKRLDEEEIVMCLGAR